MANPVQRRRVYHECALRMPSGTGRAHDNWALGRTTRRTPKLRSDAMRCKSVSTRADVGWEAFGGISETTDAISQRARGIQGRLCVECANPMEGQRLPKGSDSAR